MNDVFFELKGMIESIDNIKNLDKSHLLEIIRDSVIKNSVYSKQKPLKKPDIDYYTNKANILNYATEYILRYNELPVITL